MSHLHYRDDTVSLYTGEATSTLRRLPEQSVDCVVTSPPYWHQPGSTSWGNGTPRCPQRPPQRCGSREHSGRSRPDGGLMAGRGGGGVGCHLGRNRPGRSACTNSRLEPDQPLRAYLDRLREAFAQVHRVLTDTGTAWLNLSDSNSPDAPTNAAEPPHAATLRDPRQRAGEQRHGAGVHGDVGGHVIGMPWRVALALQADGWIVRNAIVWHTPNAASQERGDRQPDQHGLLFLLVKRKRYYFDLDATAEPYADRAPSRADAGVGADSPRQRPEAEPPREHSGSVIDTCTHSRPGQGVRAAGQHRSGRCRRGKNPGDVWSVPAPTQPQGLARGAAYPVELGLRAITAGCPPGGVVLDPFSAAATTGLAARQLARRYIGIEPNPALNDIGMRRLGLTHNHRDEPAGDA